MWLQLHSEVNVDVNFWLWYIHHFLIFHPHFKLNCVSDSGDLPADDLQTLLSKMHTAVRFFVDTTNAFYKSEESTSDRTTKYPAANHLLQRSRSCLAPTPPMLSVQVLLFSAVYQLSSANIRQLTVNMRIRLTALGFGKNIGEHQMNCTLQQLELSVYLHQTR